MSYGIQTHDLFSPKSPVPYFQKPMLLFGISATNRNFYKLYEHLVSASVPYLHLQDCFQKSAGSIFSYSLQAQMKLNYVQKELKTKQAEVKKMDGGYKKDKEALEAVRKTKGKLESQMKMLNYEGLYRLLVCNLGGI